MNDVVKLPAHLKTLEGPQRVNDALRSGTVRLDWSAVRKAPGFTLALLLKGLDLSNDADVLGLDTIPENLADAVLAALDTEEPGSKI